MFSIVEPFDGGNLQFFVDMKVPADDWKSALNRNKIGFLATKSLVTSRENGLVCLMVWR